MLLRITELLVVVLVLAVIFSQVVIPMLIGRPTWPVFSRKAKAEQHVAAALDAWDTEQLESYARNIRRPRRPTQGETNGIQR